LLLDVKDLIEKKVGKVEFPDKLLKKIMLMNNKDKDEKFVDDNYDNSIKALLWQLAKEQLVEANG
jgi:trigger factor